MSQLQWNPIQANFGGSTDTARTALAGISQAGNVFENISKSIAQERQNEIQNKLATEEESRQKQLLQQSLLQDRDAAEVSAALQDAYSSSIDPTGKFNFSTFTELSKGIVPQTKAGAEVANTYMNKLSSDRQFEISQAFNEKQLSQQRELEQKRIKATLQAANINAKSRLQEEFLKQAREERKEKRESAKIYREEQSKFTPEETIKKLNLSSGILDMSSTPDYNLTTENNIKRLFSDTKDPSSKISGLYNGISPKLMSNILSGNLKTEDAIIGGIELTSDAQNQLAAAVDGTPSFITSKLVINGILNNRKASNEQYYYLINNPDFVNFIPKDVLEKAKAGEELKEKDLNALAKAEKEVNKDKQTNKIPTSLNQSGLVDRRRLLLNR